MLKKLCGLLCVVLPSLAGAETGSGQLRTTVAALDKKLFDAYNACDLKTMGALVSEDLEFYHDQTGLEVGRQPFLEAIKENICGKVHRTLVDASLEVYRIGDYGALEIGAHRFTHPGQEKDEPGEAKFVMLWRLKDGNWQLTRVFSYDHAAARR